MFSPLRIWLEWRELRAVLHEARRQQADTAEWGYFRFKNAMIEAQSTIDRGDLQRANHILNDAFERYPGQALRSNLVLNVLLHLKRFDEAESLMAEGRRKKPY